MKEKNKGAFNDICFAIREKAAKDLKAEYEALARQAAAKGFGGSLLYAIDKASAKAVEDAAPRMLSELVTINEADPATDTDQRAEELARLLSEKIDALGEALGIVYIAGMDKWAKSMSFDWHRAESELGAFRDSIEHARLTLCAKARVAASAASSKPMYAMNNTFHAAGAVVQQGHQPTANVNQAFVSAAPTSAEVLAALAGIRAAIEKAGAPADTTRNALEVIDDLEKEAKREKPNPMRVDGLIKGAGDALKLANEVPKFVDTLTSWGHALANLVS